MTKRRDLKMMIADWLEEGNVGTRSGMTKLFGVNKKIMRYTLDRLEADGIIRKSGKVRGDAESKYQVLDLYSFDFGSKKENIDIQSLIARQPDFIRAWSAQ